MWVLNVFDPFVTCLSVLCVLWVGIAYAFSFVLKRVCFFISIICIIKINVLLCTATLTITV